MISKGVERVSGSALFCLGVVAKAFSYKNVAVMCKFDL